MAIEDITKPMALDETLQATNTALELLGKDTTLQSIVTALAGIGINTVGNLASLVTTDKTSLVGAVNEVAGDVDDIDTAKADKVDSATSGNLASLDGNGNLADSGWTSDKTTTSASGNPISIPDLKSNQLAKDPIITLEPIQAGSGDPSPVNERPISGYDKIEVLSCGVNVWDEEWRNGYYNNGVYVFNANFVCSKNPTKCIPNGTYYGWTNQSASGRIMLAFYTESMEFIENTFVKNTTFTIPANASYFHLYCEVSMQTYDHNVSINYPATDTQYHPYHKTTDLSESLGQTVYGGSLDLRSGKFTVTWIKEVIDNNTTVLNSDFSSIGVIQYLKNEMKQNAQIISDKLSSNTSDSLYVRSYHENTNRIMIVGVKSVLGVTNATEWATYLSSNPITVCYELATPFTIQLTPHEISLLKDYAYVSTNGTNMSFSYHNGEMASLADVAQVGETLNTLGGGVSDLDSKSKQFNLNYVSNIIFKSNNTVFTIEALTENPGVNNPNWSIDFRKDGVISIYYDEGNGWQQVTNNP